MSGSGTDRLDEERRARRRRMSWASRSEDDSGGKTSPEELIAAAHASCFSMALSHGLAQAGNATGRAPYTLRPSPSSPAKGSRRSPSPSRAVFPALTRLLSARRQRVRRRIARSRRRSQACPRSHSTPGSSPNYRKIAPSRRAVANRALLLLLALPLFAGSSLAATKPTLTSPRACADSPGFTCMTLAVPLDHSGHVHGALKLQVAVQDAAPTLGVLVFLTGGPGQPGAPFQAASFSGSAESSTATGSS